MLSVFSTATILLMGQDAMFNPVIGNIQKGPADPSLKPN